MTFEGVSAATWQPAKPANAVNPNQALGAQT
jgi:hypothetical protein